MQDETLTASVQYGDYSGTVEADRHDDRNLIDLAQKHGIDTERYFVIGANVYIGETRGNVLAKPWVSILAVDTSVVPAYGVDPIQRWIDSHGGVLPCVKFRVETDLQEVLLAFKRFDLVLKNRYVNAPNGYRVTEEETNEPEASQERTPRRGIFLEGDV